MLREEIEMEKRCLFCTALATLVIFTGAILFFIIYTGGEDICTSKRCVQTANELMTSLDQAMDPCEDFYEFACGNVRRLLEPGLKNERTYDYDSNRQGDDDDDDGRDYLSKAKTSSVRHMIEEPANPYDTKSLSKIKTFYRSCARTPRNRNETFGGITTDGIRTVLRDIGGWPMLERSNWREERFDWIAAVLHLRKHGIDEDIFIQTDIVRNRFDLKKYILMIRISKDYLGGARINTEGDKKLFVEYMVEVASYFGVDRMRSQRDSYEIMEFLEQLKKIREITYAINNLWSIGNTSEPDSVGNFNPRSITQLQHDVPDIEWISYINGIVGPSIQLTADEFVYAPDIDELKRLVDLLKKTPKKILANYLCWRFMHTYVSHLPDPALHVRLTKFGKFHPKRNRREICTRLIRNKMPEMVEACYVRKYVTDDVKRITKDIIEAIKRELVKMADALDWLDADIKQVSKEKLASVRDYVAYTPEMPATTSSMAEVYDRIDFEEDNFMANLMRIQLARTNIKYHKLRQPFVQHVYSEIEYSVINNILVLPSDYLQAFYVDETRPLYMNFGVLGVLIAYQLANVFLEGRRYDVHGELREWSTSQSLFNYDNKTRCLTRQYEDFHLLGSKRNLNASETQQDDVALLFGKLVAYKAYEAYLESHATEERLPGLQYSTKQLFWIASAMDECYQKPSHNHPNHQLLHTDADYLAQNEMSESAKLPRSASKLRVVGPLRNSDDFAKDFHCSIDSYMNPAEKCALW